MTIKKPWKVVGGTLAAAVTLGSTAAVAQSGNAMPDTIDLDDVVTIDQVTETTIASLFSDTPTITLDDSIASITDGIDDETADEDDSLDSPSVESPDDTADEDDSLDSPSVESPDDTADEDDSLDSPSVESPDDTADEDDSPDDSPDSDDSDD